MDEAIDQWKALPDNVREALLTSWSYGVPPLSSALYGRWWQLETWLRSLVYVELRAAYGPNWVEHLPSHASQRQEGDTAFAYMETPDAEARLAYADARALSEIVTKHWHLFNGSLLAKSVWSGRMEELLAIRNRIGHCRRPHADDLGRLELTLRDLQNGAEKATKAFNNRYRPDDDCGDPVATAWHLEEHLDARRLVGHAHRQYETTFSLEYSRRPWVSRHVDKRITGTAGFLWHATWYFRQGGQIDLRRFWIDTEYFREPIVLVCASSPHSLEVSFSALDDPDTIADSIGRCFDAALGNLNRSPSPNNVDRDWVSMNAELDSRVHTLSQWTVDAHPHYKVSMFGA